MTDSAATPQDPDQLATRLHSAAIHLLRQLRREDDSLGISAARLSALSVVGFGGPHTLGELATAEQVTPPTMSRIVAVLEADGLVSRTTDSADRRVSRIAVTPKGRRVLERGRSRRTAKLARRLAALSPADLQTLTTAASLLEQILREP
jgi:DNA-binding MarR family transcriptional regulator